MVKSKKEIQAGGHWAYREKYDSEMEEVVILQVGEKRPTQARLGFLDPAQEGLEAWRPIQRLVVPWHAKDAFLAWEDAFISADSISPNLTTGELEAIVYVVGAAGAEPCLDTWLGNSRAMMRITDSRLLSVKLGPEAGEIPSNPLTFEDKKGLVVPWPVAEWILSRLAKRFSEECLTCAEKWDEEIEDIHLSHGAKKGELRDPHALKMTRELRDISEALRKWVNEPTGHPSAHQ